MIKGRLLDLSKHLQKLLSRIHFSKRLFILIIPAVLFISLLAFEGFIYARTMSFVAKGDGYFKVDKYSEALTEYQKAASIWSKSLLLRRVKSSPVDWRSAKVEKSIADLPKALTPEIEVVSWEVKNYSCSAGDYRGVYTFSCSQISSLPSIINGVYAACGGPGGYCPSSETTLLIAEIKNKSSFPAFSVDAALDYGNGERVQVISSDSFTYIPPGESKILEKVLPVAPKGVKPKLEVSGVTYYEDNPYYLRLKEIEFLSVSILEGKASVTNDWEGTVMKNVGHPDDDKFTIKFQNTSGKRLITIGIDLVLKARNTVVIGKSNQFVVAPYIRIYDGPETGYLSTTRSFIDETKQGRPTVQETSFVTADAGEVVTFTDELTGYGGYLDQFDVVAAHVFGMEAE